MQQLHGDVQCLQFSLSTLSLPLSSPLQEKRKTAQKNAEKYFASLDKVAGMSAKKTDSSVDEVCLSVCVCVLGYAGLQCMHPWIRSLMYPPSPSPAGEPEGGGGAADLDAFVAGVHQGSERAAGDAQI